MLSSLTLTNLPLASMKGAVSQMKEILGRYDIQIREDSALESAFLEIESMGSSRVTASEDESRKRQRQEFRKALSLEWFAEKIILAESSPDFRSLVPHIRLLAGTDNFAHCAASPSDQPADQISDKVFELQIALNVIPLCSGMTLDDPVHSKPGNPDILFAFEGRKWGIACKNMHSTNPKQFCTNVLRGIAQLERASVEMGIVCVGVKELINHEELLKERFEPESGRLQVATWIDSNAAALFLRRSLIEKLGFDQSTLEHRNMRDECLRTNAYPVVVACTVAPVLIGGVARTTQINSAMVPSFMGFDTFENVKNVEHMRKFRRFLDLYGMPAMVIDGTKCDRILKNSQ